MSTASKYQDIFSFSASGRLAKDAEKLVSKKGNEYVELTVCTNRELRKDGSYGPIVLKCYCYGGTSKFASYLKRGDQIFVVGSVDDIRIWTAKKGQNAGKMYSYVNVTVQSLSGGKRRTDKERAEMNPHALVAADSDSNVQSQPQEQRVAAEPPRAEAEQAPSYNRPAPAPVRPPRSQTPQAAFDDEEPFTF